MSMIYETSFVFGKPGTYVLSYPGRCLQHNIPPGLIKNFTDYPIQQILSLALDCNDNYIVVWIAQNGERRWSLSNGAQAAYPTIKELGSKYPGVFTYYKFAFGSEGNDYVVANSANGAWVSNGADSSLTTKLGQSVARAKVLAMGMNKNYVVLFTDGSFYFNCSSTYPNLSKLLENTRRGELAYVAMNPYRGDEYFVMLANGQVHIKASAILERHIQTVFADKPELEVITSAVAKRNAEVSRTSGGIPQQARRGEFLKGIASSVGEGLVGVAISAVFAACTVM